MANLYELQIHGRPLLDPRTKRPFDFSSNIITDRPFGALVDIFSGAAPRSDMTIHIRPLSGDQCLIYEPATLGSETLTSVPNTNDDKAIKGFQNE